MTHRSPRLVVPYVAARHEEETDRESKLLFRQGRLSYIDPVDGDRDLQEVLWGRRSQTFRSTRTRQPTGTPDYGALHPSRQREAMGEMRCQVCCAEQASRSEAGWLFLLPLPYGRRPSHWPEGELVTHPPLCLKHAHLSVELCPRLRAGHAAVRVRTPRLWGVAGALYRPGSDGVTAVPVNPDPDGEAIPLPYRHQGKPHPALRHLLASQLVRELHGCTPVDLTAELAA